MPSIKILSVDDHNIVQYGLSFLIKEWNEDAKISFANTEAKIWQCLAEDTIQLVILDIIMPDIKPKKLIPKLKTHYPDIKIILYSSIDDYAILHELVNLGAIAYVNKNEATKVLFKAIESAMINEPFYSESYLMQKTRLNQRPNNIKEDLSPQEYLVFQMLVEGKGVKEICIAMNLQPSTVSTYKSRIFVKLGVENIIELIKVAQNYGIYV